MTGIRTTELRVKSTDGLKNALITHGTDDILSLDKRLKVSGKEVGSPIIFDYTVPADTTSVDIGSAFLDINAHGGNYDIEVRTVGGTSHDLNLYVNGDTVATNYYWQALNVSLTSISGGRANNATITQSAGSTVATYISLSLISGYARARSLGMYDSGASQQIYDIAWSKVAPVTNITQLTFTASVANSIKAGSRIIIRRKDI